MLKIFKKNGTLHEFVYNLRVRSKRKDGDMVNYYIFYKATLRNLYGGVIPERDLHVMASCSFSGAAIVEHHAKNL